MIATMAKPAKTASGGNNGRRGRLASYDASRLDLIAGKFQACIEALEQLKADMRESDLKEIEFDGGAAIADAFKAFGQWHHKARFALGKKKGDSTWVLE